MELTFNFSKKISILSLIVALNNNQGVLIFFTHQTVSGHEYEALVYKTGQLVKSNNCLLLQSFYLPNLYGLETSTLPSFFIFCSIKKYCN